MCALRNFFAPDADAFIREHYRTMPHSDIARALGRTTRSVRSRAAKLKVTMRDLRRWCEEDDAAIRAARSSGERMDHLSTRLGRCVSEVHARARKLGLLPWKVPTRHCGRKVLKNEYGDTVYEHRYVAEKHLGRRLGRNDIVHHIDADIDNNSIDNLHVFQGRGPHRRAHCSLEAFLPELLRRRIVEFDRTEGVYRLCETGK